MSYTANAAVDARTGYDREALRSELETTRGAVHASLETITEDRWRRQSPTSKWTTGEVFVHLTQSLEYLPKEVESARRGKGMFNYPERMADPGNYWLTRWAARKATRENVGHRYDVAMEAVLRALDAVQESDWELGARFYGEGFYTIADLFHTPARHFEEHTAGMRTQSSGV